MKQILSLTLAIVLGLFVIAGSPASADVAGTFTGASNHVTTGGVSVVKNADGSATVTLASDFSLDGAPDPRVGFGKDGAYIDGTDLGELKSVNGAQSYTVPAGIDVDNFNEVYIWCRKFAVPLGVASLK